MSSADQLSTTRAISTLSVHHKHSWTLRIVALVLPEGPQRSGCHRCIQGGNFLNFRNEKQTDTTISFGTDGMQDSEKTVTATARHSGHGGRTRRSLCASGLTPTRHQKGLPWKLLGLHFPSLFLRESFSIITTPPMTPNHFWGPWKCLLKIFLSLWPEFFFSSLIHYSYSFPILQTRTVTGNNSPQWFSVIFCNYSYINWWFSNLNCNDFEKNGRINSVILVCVMGTEMFARFEANLCHVAVVGLLGLWPLVTSFIGFLFFLGGGLEWQVESLSFLLFLPEGPLLHAEDTAF